MSVPVRCHRNIENYFLYLFSFYCYLNWKQNIVSHTWMYFSEAWIIFNYWNQLVSYKSASCPLFYCLSSCQCFFLIQRINNQHSYPLTYKLYKVCALTICNYDNISHFKEKRASVYSSRRVNFDHVTTISESRLREHISNTCDYSTYFRPFILLYFD